MSRCCHLWSNPQGYGAGTVPSDCRRSAAGRACTTTGAHVSEWCQGCGAHRVACPTGDVLITAAEAEEEG